MSKVHFDAYKQEKYNWVDTPKGLRMRIYIAIQGPYRYKDTDDDEFILRNLLESIKRHIEHFGLYPPIGTSIMILHNLNIAYNLKEITLIKEGNHMTFTFQEVR